MTGWTFQVGTNPTTQSGALNWNPNGTLNNVAITDSFYTGASQTCYYNPSSGAAMGYDDLGRLLNVSCGTNGSIWNQAFTFDQYDNLTKYSTGPGISWMPGYSATTNHYALGSAQYDSDGNVTNDSFNTYSYNEFSRLKSINGNGANCGSGGQCVIYDAFGRVVEIDSGASNTEIWYTQLGKTAFMNGSTYLYSYWPAPGGATVVDQTDGYHFLHKDWLGNARISSDVLAQTVISDQAFAPYGEIYNSFGSANASENMFTGDTQDIMATGNCCYETPNRELSGNQGRWLTSDPAGASWNAYAYGTNPNSSIDPTGMFMLGEDGAGDWTSDGLWDWLSGGIAPLPGDDQQRTYTVDGLETTRAFAMSILASGAGYVCPACGTPMTSAASDTSTTSSDEQPSQTEQADQQQKQIASCSGPQVPCMMAFQGSTGVVNAPALDGGTISSNASTIIYQVADVNGDAIIAPMIITEDVVDAITGTTADFAPGETDVPYNSQTGIYPDAIGYLYDSTFGGYDNSWSVQTFSVQFDGMRFDLPTTIWQFSGISNYALDYAFPVIVIP
jgi:RHS repeat-associated protein